jgi:diguanylate cyclase
MNAAPRPDAFAEPVETDVSEVSPPPQSWDFDAAAALADRAVGLARTYRTAPVPQIYDVWYAYAQGSHPAVTEGIDTLLRQGGTISAYDLLQIQTEHLSVERQQRARLDEANGRLERELANVLRQVQSHVNSSETYCGALAERVRDLDSKGVAGLRKTIEALIADNSAMRAETLRMGNSLKKSQEQVQNLRVALRKARENEQTDPLTGIANRRGFQLRMASEMERAARDVTPLCLVIADLDHFKSVNDRFGHLIGDEVLKYFAATITRHAGEGDLASRYGGEEFAILMPRTGAAEARERAEAMRRGLETSRLYITESKEHIGAITASFGITEFAIEDDFASFVRRADQNLYKAKCSGRNRTVGDV